MGHTLLNALSIDTSIGELPSLDSSIDVTTTGDSVSKIFQENPANPGVIILENNVIKGLISREVFFEKTGKRFGVEVFLGRPISTMLDQYSSKPLVLAEKVPVSQAIHEALKRDSRSIYDPIIVAKEDSSFRVLDILTVFLAENQILLTMHNQHVFTVSNGIHLTDEEAIRRFVKFTKITGLTNPAVLINRNSINCDCCGQRVDYTIADVVRSHPQLNRGVEITSKMGNKSYVLYVRHTCGKEIREIPVLYDHELQLRALRPSRVVENYV
ncbi:hypothetical protein [Leptolinea tardivitalis]|uniref:CBS domain-containing protein n=1 Tax=Leptolinea tardivitalis TaxID=229920 RepID=A0A0N8GLL9_9CHLR|nr:hypothetical protein [Leptolinea tardivitalis]KPL72866.1 hypothetical protein ADM99_07405 [Leptolinea tardivitalis]GAP20752.1 hypothetical protein LTAR_00947 [Leptolinea tardivitalis]